MQPEISVIMPIYNTGSILENTINSILAQSFSNFELILVDDGSSDSSGELCDWFAQKDNRIKVIHKENAGTCAARNVGIEISRGRYITFCDHDDVYSIDILEKEIELISQYDGVEMAIVGALHIYDDGSEYKYGKNLIIKNRDELKKEMINILKTGVVGTVWNVLYRRDLIGDIRFDEKITKGHEDIIFNINILRRASSIMCNDNILYYHYIRKSMSTSAGYHKEMLEAIKIANNQLCNLCLEVIDSTKRLDYINLQGEYIRGYSTYCNHLNISFKEYKKAIKELNYIPVKFSFIELIKFKSKDAFSFYCRKNEFLWLHYYIIKLNNLIKRKC